jgi:hypothetical protein
LLPAVTVCNAIRRTASLHSNSDLRNGGKSECRLRLRFTGFAVESRVDAPETDGEGFDASFAVLPAVPAVAGRFRGSGTTSVGGAADVAREAVRGATACSRDASEALPFSSAVSRGDASAGRSVGSNGATAGIGSSIPH